MADEETPAICEACGSDRILDGPYYSKRDWVCLDCGHRKEMAQVFFAETPQETDARKAQDAMDTAHEVLAQPLTMEDMKDPAKMAAYLKSLEAATQDLSKTDAAEQTQKVRSPRKRKNAAQPASEVEQAAETELDRDLIFQTINFYQRRNSSWQEVCKQAREEKEYRNDNILFFAHSHAFGEACTDTCKQV